MTDLPSYADSTSWADLSHGGPTILALAHLAARRWSDQEQPSPPADTLTAEAQAILHTARDRGVVELKVSNKAFESADRLLTVFVEIDDHHWMRFRIRSDIRASVRFLQGFRQLCDAGLVVHHLNAEFTLSESGFVLAREVQGANIAEVMKYGQVVGLE